jgi:hypothetical protein
LLKIIPRAKMFCHENAMPYAYGDITNSVELHLEISQSCSQEPATGPYPEPIEYTPYPSSQSS